jgi:hypothetical protein
MLLHIEVLYMGLNGIVLTVLSLRSSWLLVLLMSVCRNFLEVFGRLLACPHLLSFLDPVSELQEYVLHRLGTKVVLAFVCLRFVDCVEICKQADIACADLRDDRADRSVCAKTSDVLKFSLPGFAPSLCSCLLCLVASHDFSHSFLAV